MTTETFGHLVIGQARPTDLDAVVSMLEEAARWMVRRGIEGWTPDGFSRERIAVLIESGEMYLAVLDGRPAGTFALQWSERETWGNIPDDAGYIHGLAIRREFAGAGLGREMLRRAEQMVARSEREYLRLDCVADNEALNEYYLRVGFTRGEAPWSGGLLLLCTRSGSVFRGRDRRIPAAILTSCAPGIVKPDAA